MPGALRPLIIAALALALAGCGAGPDAWNAPAGAAIDEGGFGAATRANLRVQSGGISQVEGLNERFSAETVPVVTFPFDSAVPGPAARAAIARQADWIRQFPEATFRIFGHTDLVGSDAYNRALGRRRAEAVLAELVRNGVAPGRLEALVSYGETQPLIVTRGRERANRRTVTEVSGFIGGRQRLLDGKYAQVIYRGYVESAVPPPGLVRRADPAAFASGGESGS